MKDDKFYLIHISECIQKIENYAKEGHTEFLNSPKTQDAIIRNFEIIGEATKRLSQNLKQKYPDLPWKEISGFRDVLIHDYFGVDLDEVWNIIESDLAKFKQTILSILQQIKK